MKASSTPQFYYSSFIRSADNNDGEIFHNLYNATGLQSRKRLRHFNKVRVLYFADADPEFVAVHIRLFPNLSFIEGNVWSLAQALCWPARQDWGSIFLVTQVLSLQNILRVLTK